MRKIIVNIKNDRILDILLLGVLGPLGFLIIVVISAISGITLPVNLGSSFANILLIVFNVSVPLLIGYLAFVKLKIFNKSSLTKFFSALWILLSVIASFI